ncbi:unnamed protein product [Mesocestoides corti]|uniref:MBD domain-containing protein n=1 Tax=Mesocestoides corti TaxID=53468 RepID=A0A0R3U5B2_MESCO|nr:unnamed protein product [Mesocestoides corti]
MAAYPRYISQSPLSVNKQIAQNMMFQKVTINHTSPASHKSTSALPNGWKREEALRPQGLNNGKSIVSYISPSGAQIRTQKELQIALGDRYDVSLFDWRSGKFSSPPLKHKMSATSESRLDDTDSDWCRRISSSSFPKPLILLNHNDSKQSDKPSTQECLKQLFSERRLADRTAVDHRDGKTIALFSLPQSIESAGVPGYDKNQLIQNLIVSLASKRGPITGQERTVEQNPCAVLNRNQPFVKSFVITDEDIRKHQQRVTELRERLQALRKLHTSVGCSSSS